MSTQRERIYAKSDGHCWYCGCDLSDGKWHKDHAIPILRKSGNKGSWVGEDTEENMVPACSPCNLFKGVWSVEDFRHEISMQTERARKNSVNFRTAERFNQIEVKPQPVVFWFESFKAS